jgi:hypothetical protein
LTREWQKIVLTPDTHPHLNVIDSRKAYILSFDVRDKQGDSNVIWLDEIKLLLDETKAQF